MFFVGATNLLLAMAWWTAWLLSANASTPWMPQPRVPAGWLHAFVMQYQMLPSFMFGFLLTVFPRWMGLAELPRWRYLPVGFGLFGGQIVTLVGATGPNWALVAGWAMTALGWLAGVSALAPHLWRERGTTWHAWSCLCALLVGLSGLAMFGAFLLGAGAWWLFASIKIGTFGFLLLIYLTVAHRMFPFFAGNVVAGYVPWRPLWLLAAFWLGCLAHLALELVHAYVWLWTVDVPMFLLTAYLCRRWWPRQPHAQRPPPLLMVLFLGLAWLPATFALYSAQSIWYVVTGAFELGRAPAHALFIGFFGSVLVAMVTRVTQGHAGRPLVLPPIAVFAFATIQLVAIVRIAADVARDPMLWHALAGVGWLLALGPWALWLAWTYLAPRADGKPG
ncbi:NnrS family protein [Sinimarinibacterium sp. CAU 1509]|nr:NnrS family protein [Sinimarinibacterium sp. CAU 1509]